jgi:AraC-like DNA-binding protein
MDLGLPSGAAGSLRHYHNAGNRGFPHSHPELEINLVLAGKASYLLGERRYELTANTLVWLFPGQTHILTEKSPDLEMWIGLFRPAMLRIACRDGSTRILREDNPAGDFCRRLQPTQTRRLCRLFDDLLIAAGLEGAAMGTPPAADARDLWNSGLAYALLSTWDVYTHADHTPLGTFLHPAVRKAVEILCRQEEIGAAALASEAGLSPSRLSELFNQQVGMSVSEFRNRQRITRFLELYEDGTGRTLLSAALDAGFGSYLQFYRVFSRIMGVGPSEYRRGLTPRDLSPRSLPLPFPLSQ